MVEEEDAKTEEKETEGQEVRCTWHLSAFKTQQCMYIEQRNNVNDNENLLIILFCCYISKSLFHNP